MRALLFAAMALALAAPAAGQAARSPLDSVTYPIAQLGGCASAELCAQWCDEPAHVDACSDFASRQGMPGATSFPVAELGSCASLTACRAYCDETDHLVACVDYAERVGILNPHAAQQARLAIPHLAAGTAPGGCRSETECVAYCEDAEHAEACVAFGEKIGVLTPVEAAAARDVLLHGGPGGCRTKESCMAVCDDPANRRACFDFAKEHALVSEEEAAMGERFLAAGGVGPNGCASKEDCMATCDEPANFDACVNFAHDLGVLNDDDWKAASVIRDSGGPGGCRTKDQCEQVCADPANMDACAEAFGVNSHVAFGGEMPAACVERALGPDDCRAFCQSDGAACAGAGAVPPDALPPACVAAGATTSPACAQLCASPPFPCSAAAPGGGTAPEGGAPPADLPVGGVAQVCAAAGISDAFACSDFCAQQGLPCALPEGMGGGSGGGAPGGVPTSPTPPVATSPMPPEGMGGPPAAGAPPSGFGGGPPPGFGG